MIGLAMQLGLAAPLAFMAPHAAPAPPRTPPVVISPVRAPATPVQATAPGSGVSEGAPPAPVPTTSTTTTTAAPVDTRQCRVTFPPTVQTSPSTGVSGTYGGGFRGPCVDAYPYAAAFPGSVVTVIPN